MLPLTFAPAWLIALSVIAAASGDLIAQDRERVSGAVSCDGCSITMDTIVSIGGMDGPGLAVVSEYSVVAVDRRGRFLVSDVQRNEGRTLLDHDFNVVRTDRLPGQFLSGYAYATDSEDIVLKAESPTPDGIGHDFHVLSLDGEMSSFGGNRARSFHIAGDSETMWALQESVNAVVRWQLGAEPAVTRVFERVVDMFDRGPRGVWPGTNVGGIAVDRGGLLWIRWFTPDSEWTQPLRGRRPPLQEVFDNYLDVVDPQTGLTLARYRSDHVVKFVNGFEEVTPYVYATEMSDAGVVHLHIMKARLEGAAEPRGANASHTRRTKLSSSTRVR